MIKNPRIVVVNGNVCSGSSTLARSISSGLGYELLEVGEMFKARVRQEPSCDVLQVSADLNSDVEQKLAGGDGLVIEGRLVGKQARGLPGILRLLCIAPKEIILERYMRRESVTDADAGEAALAQRYAYDSQFLGSAAQGDAFDPRLYDLVLDTSNGSPDELLADLDRDGYIHL